MPKQIISDALEELGELGKQTAKQIAGEPAKMAQAAAQQTGLKPQTAEEKAAEEAKINEMKTKDAGKTGKDLAFWRSRVDTYNQTSAQKPSGQGQPEKKEVMGQALLGQSKSNQLPPLQVSRKASRVERKLGVGG